MHLKHPFLKLPIQFDAAALEAEVRALPITAWDRHPSGFVGNEAVKLISVGGGLTDLYDGPMGPTIHLRSCEYIQEIMAEIGAVWGRSRLMGLAAGSEVPRHVDINYYWRTHWRIHIPVITNPGVEFTCGDETVHMAAGECWVFDSFRFHRVENKGSERRIHLVIDTVGGGILPDLMAAAEEGNAPIRTFLKGEGRGGDLGFEQVNAPDVMSPWEMRCHVAFIMEHAQANPALPEVRARIDRFIDDWAAAWAQFGTDHNGLPTYSNLLQRVNADLERVGAASIRLSNDIRLYAVLRQLILQKAIGSSVAVANADAGRQRAAS